MTLVLIKDVTAVDTHALHLQGREKSSQGSLCVSEVHGGGGP